MLSSIRKHAYSWTTRIVLGAIAVIFMFWGIGTGFFNQVHPVAVVDGKNILPDQVDREADQIRRTMQQVYGSRANAILKAVNLREEATQRVIENELIAREAQRLGLEVDDAQLQKVISSEKAFQTGGQFNFDQYQEVLRENNLTPADYEASQRTQVVQDMLRNMVADAVQVSDDEARQAFDLANQNLNLAYIQVPYSSFMAKINPSDKEVADFYQREQQAFEEPERIKLSYIKYDPLELAANLKPSDKEIQDYYNRRLKTEFTHPEQVRARHILIKVAQDAPSDDVAAAKGRADDILKQIKNGADFAALAKKDSEDDATAVEGGDLGFFSRGQLVKSFEDAAFSLQPGQMSIARSQFGFHVIRVEEVKPAHVDNLAEAHDKIVEDLRREAGERAARTSVNEDLAASLNGTSLADIGKKRGLAVNDTPFFAQGEQVQDVPKDPALIAQAFKYDSGQTGVVTSGKIAYIVKVDARQTAHVPPLDQIKARVRQSLVQLDAEKAASELATKLLGQIKSPSDFDSVAAQNKLTVQKTGAFSRATHTVPGVGDFTEVTDAAALVPKLPGLIDRVMEHEGDSYLFEVLSRTPPSDDDWKSKGTGFKEEYAESRRAQAWENFIDMLKTQAKIEIHSDQLGGPAEPSQ